MFYIFSLDICMTEVHNGHRCKMFRKRNNSTLIPGSPKRLFPLALTLVVLWAHPACGKAITCTAGIFDAGDTATVTCYFADYIHNRDSVYIQYYPSSAPTDASGRVVLVCKVEDVTSSRCKGQGDYVLKAHTNNTVSVGIPRVTMQAAGQYICQFLPHDGSPRDMCNLTVHGMPVSTSLSPGPKGEPCSGHDHLNAAVVIMAVLLVLILVFLLAISIVCKHHLKRMVTEWRNQRQRSNDVELSEAQHLLPANDPNSNSVTFETTAHVNENIEAVVKGFRLEAGVYERIVVLLTRDMENKRIRQEVVTATSNGRGSSNDLVGVLGSNALKIMPVKPGQNIESLVRENYAITTTEQTCNVRLKMLVNTAVDMLVAAADDDPSCKIALVLTDGVSACYPGNENREYITAEFGSYGDGGCLDLYRTDFDIELDRNPANNPHVLEKMVSLVYLGELVRLVLVKLTEQELLFTSVPRESALYQPWSFKTDFISLVDRDTDRNFGETRYVLRQLEVEGFTDNHCRTVQYVCRLISERAAYLAATVLAVLIRRVNQPGMTVAVEESLGRLYPRIYQLMLAKTRALVGEDYQFNIKTFSNESGKGAAILAATH